MSGGGAATEAVGAHAQVTLGVDRAAAERAVGAPGLHHERGTAYERARGSALEAHQEDLLRLGLVRLVVTRLREREDLDHHALDRRVPGQRHGARPELLVDRLLER